jgi:hypothetical protein
MTFEEAMQAMREGKKVRIKKNNPFDEKKNEPITIWSLFSLTEENIF